MIKQIPFVKNYKDDMHCVNAVFRMVHQFYFDKDLSWEEIDYLTKAEKGKATWTFIGEMEFAKKGLKIINIEPIDYQKLYEEGINYLNKVVGSETAKYYFEKSNIKSVLKYIPKYLKIVKHETRRITIDEIINFLKKGYLIGAEINSSILNKKSGFSLHFVLIYDFDGENLILHDPGNPPIQSRKVSLKEFDKCFNFKGANGGVVIFSGESVVK